jgi:hypothetical protein
MIRLFVYTIVRVIIIGLAFYVGLIIFKWIIKTMQGRLRSSSDHPQSGEPTKPKENYKDVQDASFVELPDKKKEEKPL